MGTFCATGGNSKFRPNFTSSNYYHGAPCPRNGLPPGSEYTSAAAPSKRSIQSMRAVWQHQMSQRTLGDYKTKSRGRLCSVALAIASFLVLTIVLAIAGMALYMGAFHTEPASRNNIILFSCSARVMRGDRFNNASPDKIRIYKLLLETLYQRSVLGPALVSCTVDHFGANATIFFQLTLNKEKLNGSVLSIKKSIKDILLADAVSRKPVFRNIHFDSKSIQVKQIDETVNMYQRNNAAAKPKENTRQGILLKSSPPQQNFTTSLTVKKKSNKNEQKNKDAVNPAVQGSFKISKTDADITEKRTETTTRTAVTSTKKPKLKENVSTVPPHKTTPTYKVRVNESSSTTLFTVTTSTIKPSSRPTSNAISKPTSKPTSKLTSKPTSMSTSKPSSTTTTSTTIFTTSVFTSTSKTKETSPLFSINSHLFDLEPWVPIVPGSAGEMPIAQVNNQKQPVYTSFTNPGLSYHYRDTEKLGTAGVKSHPLPVNKIYQTTEPSIFGANTKGTRNSSDFIEIETMKYVPGSAGGNENQILKNLSAIFQNLASTLESSYFKNTTKPEEGVTVGQGHVEVVEGDEEALMMQTTKLPLVTLLPVKSNSGIGRPLRKRPFRKHLNSSNIPSVENRSFPSLTRFNNVGEEDKEEISTRFFQPEAVTPISSIIPNKDKLNDFKIVGVLNFATELPEEGEQKKLDFRNSKMKEASPFGVNTREESDEIAIYATNFSVSTNRNGEAKKRLDILNNAKLKQLSEISTVHDNFTRFDESTPISDKAISSSNTYTVNHAGFKILTKAFHKISELSGNTKPSKTNQTTCANLTVTCGDGQCLPETTKCNQLIDCNDGKDEQNCSCADYLKSQFLLRKICDGVIDCWDYSDENNCEWCTPDQYVCGNSKTCIHKKKLCDNVKDCPQGDDEQQCVTIAPSLKSAGDFPYHSEGYLMIRKFGQWGKFCVQNFQSIMSVSDSAWKISDLGKSVCRSMTYQSVGSITSTFDTDTGPAAPKYFELAYSTEDKTKSTLLFSETYCKNREVMKVQCQNLECGVRPQAVKHTARIVGGGNAKLGSWPWQAALYKEGEFQCGATLISEKWLLSAGHCFYHSQEEHWVARLGALRRGIALLSPYEQLQVIVQIVVHPGYVDSGFINDISLLKMELPVVFSDYVRPICLPPSDQTSLDGQLCTVVGWGQLFEIGRIFPDTLQEVQVPIISTAECRKRTIFLPLYKITDDMFCAGYERGGRDACLGDSGGPLMCPESSGKWMLQGITSNGYGCARANRPGVYTKVSNYVTWISTYLTENNEEPPKRSKSVCLGHRCPLGECLPKNRLCNGYIECSDGSDERDC